MRAQCELRCSDRNLSMSAYDYKRTFTHTVIYGRFTPESRPFSSLAFMSANDPKRTFVGLRGSEGVCDLPPFTGSKCIVNIAHPPKPISGRCMQDMTRSLIVRACAAVVLAACLVTGLGTGVEDAAAGVKKLRQR